MSRRYAPDHKELVYKIYLGYRGDVAATAAYTGIPERTLCDWITDWRRDPACARVIDKAISRFLLRQP